MPGQLGEPATDAVGRPAPDARIDLVEDEQHARTRGAGRAGERQQQS